MPGRKGSLGFKRVRFGHGTLFVGTPVPFGESLYVDCPDGDVLSFDRQSLATRWQSKAEGFGPIILVHRNVVVLDSFQSQLRGLSTADGHVVWTIPRSLPEYWCHSWLDGDRIHLVPKNDNERIIDVHTGETLETRAQSFPFGAIAHGGIVDQGGLRIFWDRTKDVQGVWDTVGDRLLWQRCLYAGMGERCGEAWPTTEEGMNESEASAARAKQVGIIREAFGDSDVFVVRYGHFLFGCSLAEGGILWQVGPMDVHLAKPVIADGRAYVLMSRAKSPYSHESRFLCLDLGTGQTVYDLPLEGIEPLEPHLPVLTAAGIVWTLQHCGRMLLVRRSDGKLLWTQRHKADVYLPLLDGDRLIFPASDGSLLVYEGLSRLEAL